VARWAVSFSCSQNSRDLDKALSKIKFEGYERNVVRKWEYNKDYWEIYAYVPEPAMYGAGIMAMSVAALAYRRRTRSRSAK